jgi:hypothetical protein
VALTTDQQTMRDAVRRTADVVAFTDKHPDSRINELINQGLGALSRLCRTTNPAFQPVASTIIPMDGAATAYGLPVNMRSLLSVEYTGDSGFKSWLTPFEPFERSALTDPETTEASVRAYAYRLEGSNIEFLPRAPAGHSALLWYATTMTQLTGNNSQFDTLDRLDTWVIWWAAREIAMEREAWERHDRLGQKLAEMSDEIRILARSQDLSHPHRVVDVTFQPRMDLRRRGRW